MNDMFFIYHVKYYSCFYLFLMAVMLLGGHMFVFLES